MTGLYPIYGYSIRLNLSNVEAEWEIFNKHIDGQSEILFFFNRHAFKWHMALCKPINK